MDIFEQLKPQVEQVEVSTINILSEQVDFEYNQLKSCKGEETSGTSVRVVKEGRLGFSASSDDSAGEKLIENVLSSARYGDQVPIQFPAPQAPSAAQAYDPYIADLSIQRMLEIGKESVELILQSEPAARVNIRLNRSLKRTSLHNQAGSDLVDESTSFVHGIEVNLIQGDDILILYDLVNLTRWNEDYLAPVYLLVDKLKKARVVTPIVKPGPSPVIFSPSGSLALLLPLNEALNGKNAYTGISPLTNRLGESIFDEQINLTDDGTYPGAGGSSRYDSEGIPHRRNDLVKKGVLTSFMLDLKTAAQIGMDSTGNGARSLFNPPSPAATNWIVEPGATSVDEMVKGIKDGLLVEELLGLGQGNILSGAFSNPLGLAFSIKNGEIIGRVKNTSIAGNIYDLLKNVSGISRETHWVYGTYLLPYVLLPEVNVVTLL